MIAKTKSDINAFHANKEALKHILDQIDEQAGMAHDPTATAQKARAMMRAQGVRAEDNNASRELMRIRYGDDCDKE